jgi:hypothetical protein
VTLEWRCIPRSRTSLRRSAVRPAVEAIPFDTAIRSTRRQRSIGDAGQADLLAGAFSGPFQYWQRPWAALDDGTEPVTAGDWDVLLLSAASIHPMLLGDGVLTRHSSSTTRG